MDNETLAAFGDELADQIRTVYALHEIGVHDSRWGRSELLIWQELSEVVGFLGSLVRTMPESPGDVRHFTGETVVRAQRLHSWVMRPAIVCEAPIDPTADDDDEVDLARTCGLRPGHLGQHLAVPRPHELIALADAFLASAFDLVRALLWAMADARVDVAERHEHVGQWFTETAEHLVRLRAAVLNG